MRVPEAGGVQRGARGAAAGVVPGERRPLPVPDGQDGAGDGGDCEEDVGTVTEYKIRVCGLGGDRLVDAEGAEAIELPNADGLEFFVHHGTGVGGPPTWAVSERSTGTRLASGATRLIAIRNARKRLATVEPGVLRERTDAILLCYGGTEVAR